MQESWFRLSRAGRGDLENMRAWLTTVVGRICLDMLRARQARPEDSVDAVPEPVVSIADENQAQEAELADSVGLALLVVLEDFDSRRAPGLRTPRHVRRIVLGDRVDRRTLAGRGPTTRQPGTARRVRGSVLPTDADLAQQRKVVDAFLAAARSGDFEALLEVLDPDAVFRMHTGPSGRALPAVGAAAVAEANAHPRGSIRPPRPAGDRQRGAGVLVAPRGQNVGSCRLHDLARPYRRDIDLIVDPERLRKLEIHG